MKTYSSVIHSQSKTLMFGALFKLSCLLVLATLLTSCGTGAYKPGSLKSVSIDPNIKMPDRMRYNTAGQQWAIGIGAGLGGIPGGIVAAAAVGNTHRDPDTELRDFVRTELVQALTAEISETKLVKVLPSPQGEGRIQVELWLWGFGAKLFDGKMQAGVIGKLNIVDSTGKKIWSCMLPRPSDELKNTPAFKNSELKGNLPLIKQQLARQIRLLAKDAAYYMQGRR